MYQPLSQQAAALKSLSRGQHYTPERTLDTSALSSKGSQPKSRASTTPLQRLGQQALRKTRSHLGSDVPVSQQQHLVVEGDESTQIIPHPAATNAINSSTLKGSEDLIVPSSEDENESEGVEDTIGGSQAQLDLAKFAFTPK
jgi:hypothetical protein